MLGKEQCLLGTCTPSRSLLFCLLPRGFKEPRCLYCALGGGCLVPASPGAAHMVALSARQMHLPLSMRGPGAPERHLPGTSLASFGRDWEELLHVELALTPPPSSSSTSPPARICPDFSTAGQAGHAVPNLLEECARRQANGRGWVPLIPVTKRCHVRSF